MVSVRYSMTQDGFSRTSPYVIAEDVSAETVGVISEHASEWPGIETRVAVTRTYGEDGSLAPHVVGYTGVITDTQYQQAVEDGNTYDAEDNISGYKWSDTMGRSGLEAAFEEELRGKRGRGDYLHRRHRHCHQHGGDHRPRGGPHHPNHLGL